MDDREKVTILPEANRDEMLKLAGLNPNSHRLGNQGSGKRKPGQKLDSDERKDRITDGDGVIRHSGVAPGGERVYWTWDELGFVPDGEERFHGTRAHRGILQSDLYVDPALTRELILARLGVTDEELRSAYDVSGSVSREIAALRARIDGKFLELADNGGNMLHLGYRLGWSVKFRKGGGLRSCQKMERALDRARAAKAR